MHAAHLDLDGAWGSLPLERIDATSFGPKIRYWAHEKDLSRFYNETLRDLPPLVVYGSGDFHHLAAWLVRRFDGPLTIVSFDNHPDWDVRPPRWSCGCWVNRALELPNVERVSVWGCGNFELAFPSRLFRNRRGLRSGRLDVHAWAERQSTGTCRRFNCMTRENWRERFSAIRNTRVYVTVDMDCLRQADAISNWEQGLFETADLAWAIRHLRSNCEVVGGDVCGAASEPRYERFWQRFAGRWDHPKLRLPAPAESRRINQDTLGVLLHAFT